MTNIYEMNEEEYQSLLREKMRKDAWGYWGFGFSNNKQTTAYREEIYLLDEEGNVIDEFVINSNSYDDMENCKKKIREFMDRIFDGGHEGQWAIHQVTTQETNYDIFDPDKFIEDREKEIENWKETRAAIKKKEEEKQKRYARWNEAVQWCADHDIRTFKGYNKRETIIKNVIKNDLQDEFNQTFPEFAISEHDIQWYQVFWGKQKDKFKGGQK